MLRKLTLISAVVCLSSFTFTARAQQSEAETKLRENLRATMLQLRNAETERANLQVAQAELEAKSKALTEQLETLTKQAATNQATADKAITELKGKVDERDREIGELRVSLDKWKTDHKKITAFAQKKETERAQLADKVIALDRRVADQQTRNLAMYKVGTEVLSRYEKFGLGDALTSREPFVGLTRVKFENLIQDYADKLADERIKPQPAPAPPAGAKPKAGAAKVPPKEAGR